MVFIKNVTLLIFCESTNTHPYDTQYWGILLLSLILTCMCNGHYSCESKLLFSVAVGYANIMYANIHDECQQWNKAWRKKKKKKRGYN